jgi:phosphoglycerate dehydrogenase-like enzyme
MPADRFDYFLRDMALLIGQSDMPKPRLDRAPKLRAIINVETNFLQNVDYDACFERGIHVLAPGPVSPSLSPRWRSEWPSTFAPA